MNPKEYKDMPGISRVQSRDTTPRGRTTLAFIAAGGYF